MNIDRPKIVLLYQSLLGIYGDHGNAVVHTKRLQWRGIDAELLIVEPGQPVPTDGAVYLLGGGEDTAQITAVQELEADGGLFTALDDGAMLFAVCAGYQICGKSFTIGARDEAIKGLGLLDAETRRGPERAVGECYTSGLSPTVIPIPSPVSKIMAAGPNSVPTPNRLLP